MRKFHFALLALCVSFASLGCVYLTHSENFPTIRIPLNNNSTTKGLSPRTEASTIDWQSMNRGTGDWVWQSIDDQSRAEFNNGQFVLVCDMQKGIVTLARQHSGGKVGTLTIWTDYQTAAYVGNRDGDFAKAILDPDDATLDAMALSRGKFGVAVSGTNPILVPNWPEVSRVIEDCRS